MSSKPPGLLGIGEFSRRSGLSIKTLRHYDRLGILRPAHVSPRTGYRYYAPGQIAEVEDCRALVLVGVPLRRVRELVRAGMTARDLQATLVETRARLGDRIRSDAARLSWLEHSLAAVDRAAGPEASPQADLVAAAATPAVWRRERLAHVREGDALRDELARRWGPGDEVMRELTAATVWHDCGRATGLVDCEAVVPLRAGRGPGPGDRVGRLPARLVARVRHAGPDADVSHTYLAGWRRLVSLGLPLVSPVREWVRYVEGEPRVTEIQFPVAPLSS
jgi:DNA-binding transcriptional MerR regulator